MNSKKILVTGSARFIGTNLVDELKSRDHNVTAVDLFNNERAINKKKLKTYQER